MIFLQVIGRAPGELGTGEPPGVLKEPSRPFKVPGASRQPEVVLLLLQNLMLLLGDLLFLFEDLLLPLGDLRLVILDAGWVNLALGVSPSILVWGGVSSSISVRGGVSPSSLVHGVSSSTGFCLTAAARRTARRRVVVHLFPGLFPPLSPLSLSSPGPSSSSPPSPSPARWRAA